MRTRSLLAACAASLSCVALTACSTHRADLQSQAPPEGAPAQTTSELADASISLLRSEATHIDLLSSEALAPLTTAAALTFKRTGSTYAYALTQQFANDLLRAQVTRAGVTGFFGAGKGSGLSPAATTGAGLALTEAYAATQNPSYRTAALAAAAAVSNPALGWISSPGGTTGVRESPAEGPNIALSANAALLLQRAGALGAPGLEAESRAALRTVYSSQAAVGRWYASVGGREPMSLAEWASTLFDLVADGSKDSAGIAGGGVPAMYNGTFDARGEVAKNDLTSGQPDGVALALRTLAAYGEAGLTEPVFASILASRRSDGTVRLAPANDVLSQADFALAFAQRLSGGA